MTNRNWKISTFLAEFLGLLMLIGSLYVGICIVGGAYLEARHSAPVTACAVNLTTPNKC